MTRLKLSLATLVAALILPFAAYAQALPDLGRPQGRGGDGERLFPAAVRRSASGKQIGWEYDAVDEIGQAAELHGRVPAQLLGRDDPGGVRQAVRLRHDRHHHQGRAQGEGRFLRSLHALGDLHAGAQRREPLHRRQGFRRRREAADRRAGRHLALLRGRLQRARRQRAEPAHQAVRDLRGHGRRRCRPATSTWC